MENNILSTLLPEQKKLIKVQSYKKNDVVNYDGYIINDGYRWISWLSLSTKKRRWMRAGKCNQKGYITYPYGQFR